MDKSGSMRSMREKSGAQNFYDLTIDRLNSMRDNGLTKDDHDRAMTAAAYWLDASPHERCEGDGLVLAQYARNADEIIRSLLEQINEHHGVGTTAKTWGERCPVCNAKKMWQRVVEIWGPDEGPKKGYTKKDYFRDKKRDMEKGSEDILSDEDKKEAKHLKHVLSMAQQSLAPHDYEAFEKLYNILIDTRHLSIDKV